MKALRKLVIPLFFAVGFLTGVARADYADDFKVDVAKLLPFGKTHQDKVRQFLKVRKFKVTESAKEKTMTGRFETRRGLRTESVLVAVFEFDDAGLLKNVRYEKPKP